MILGDHGGPGHCSHYVRHHHFFSVVKLYHACTVCNILVKIWTVNKIDEMIDFRQKKGEPDVEMASLLVFQGLVTLHVFSHVLFAIVLVSHRAGAVPLTCSPKTYE